MIYFPSGLTQFEKDMIELSYINSKKRTPKHTNNVSWYSRTKTKNFVDNYVVLDIETTGFSPKDSEIIEISALKYKDNKLIDTFSTLIKPNYDIPDRITKLTGITTNDLQSCPNIEIVLQQFLAFIEDYTLLTYNGAFDLGFIEYFFNKLTTIELTNPNIDVLYLARNCIFDTPNHKLETLKQYFNLDYQSHRALSDCYTTNFVYQYCKNNSQQDFNTQNVQSNFKKNNVSHLKDLPRTDVINSFIKYFSNSKYFINKRIVITGNFINFNRNELITLLKTTNATITGAISSKTDFLLLGITDTPTTKYKKANELISNGGKIKILTENNLLDILGIGEQNGNY